MPKFHQRKFSLLLSRCRSYPQPSMASYLQELVLHSPYTSDRSNERITSLPMEEMRQSPESPFTREPDNIKAPMNRYNLRPKKRQYVQWNKKDGDKVSSYFDNFIKIKGTGLKGPLPRVKEIEEFLKHNQDFLGYNFSMKPKNSLIKTKVFNEREKSRTSLNGMFQSF